MNLKANTSIESQPRMFAIFEAELDLMDSVESEEAGERARKDRHGELGLNGLLDLNFDLLDLGAAFRGSSS